MNETMLFRQATGGDAERIWQIILQAKEHMRRQGSRQWQEGYPAFENIVHDIVSGYGYVLTTEGNVVAYAAVLFDGEPAYDHIEGKWKTGTPYVVVHRLAVDGEMKRCGLASLFMREVAALSRRKGICAFRVDTNFDNRYMHGMLYKLGFTYCGEIHYENGLRMAFEKKL